MEKIKIPTHTSLGGWIESEKAKHILIILVVILVAICAFLLGRLSTRGENSGIKIEYPAPLVNQAGSVNSAISGDVKTATTSRNSSPQIYAKPAPANRGYVASKRGQKYYPVGCSAAKNLKPENRIFFATVDEALAAGYTLASSCK